MEITSISKPETSTGSPFADLGYNYLWELINLGEYVPAFVGMQSSKMALLKNVTLAVSMVYNHASLTRWPTWSDHLLLSAVRWLVGYTLLNSEHSTRL